VLQAGQVITSPRGTRVEILENSPARISFKRTLPAGTGGTHKNAHRHNANLERFEVLAGEAEAALDDRKRHLNAGDVLEVPRGSEHINPGTMAGTTATLVQTMEPRTRAVHVYFTSWLHWLAEGQTGPTDEPTQLQLAAIVKEGGFDGNYRTGAPVLLLRVVVPILGVVAGLKGIRAVRVPPA